MRDDVIFVAGMSHTDVIVLRTALRVNRIVKDASMKVLATGRSEAVQRVIVCANMDVTLVRFCRLLLHIYRW